MEVSQVLRRLGHGVVGGIIASAISGGFSPR
jgi:hypothetical protein